LIPGFERVAGGSAQDCAVRGGLCAAGILAEILVSRGVEQVEGEPLVREADEPKERPRYRARARSPSNPSAFAAARRALTSPAS